MKIATVIKSSPNLEKIRCKDKECKIKDCETRLHKRTAVSCHESDCGPYDDCGDPDSGSFSPLRFLLKCLSFKYKVWKLLKGLLAPSIEDFSVY
jgi:hypothetical protein